MSEHPAVPLAASLPAVSVVVPVWNGADTIVACVTSLLALSYPRDCLEIVVVDNGSTDGTRDRLARFDGAIRVLVEPRRGASAARNRGIRASRGRIVAFTDADCTVEPGWLSHLVGPLADPEVGIAGGAMLSVVGANRIERFGEIIHDHRRAIEELQPPYAVTMNWASRREVLLEAGLFDERLLRSQDVDLAWRIHGAGYRLAYVPDAIIRHRNARTVPGLLHEAYVHGRYAVAVVSSHALIEPTLRGRLANYARRLPEHLGRAVDRRPVDRVLGLLFELARLTGELAGRAIMALQRARRPPSGGSAARPVRHP
jgi:glycosyltransferase involved in cell wall biosynthesis